MTKPKNSNPDAFDAAAFFNSLQQDQIQTQEFIGPPRRWVAGALEWADQPRQEVTPKDREAFELWCKAEGVRRDALALEVLRPMTASDMRVQREDLEALRVEHGRLLALLAAVDSGEPVEKPGPAPARPARRGAQSHQSHLIERAYRAAGGVDDVGVVWRTLCSMAHAKEGELIEVVDGEVKYQADSGEAAFIKRKAVGDWLRNRRGKAN